jgi:tripartite ATP-independent transporter DctM subunit
MFLNYLRKLVRFVVMACCGILVLTVFVSVLLRYVFGLGLSFSEDLVRYIMVVIVFFASSLAFDSKQHVSIRLIVNKLSKLNQLRLDLFSYACLFAFLIILMIQGIQILPVQLKTDIPTMTGVSIFWFYLSIPIGCILMIIFLIPQFLSSIKEFKGRETLASDRSTNSMWSILLICLFFAGLVTSSIFFFYGYKSLFFLILFSCFFFTVSIGVPVAFGLGIAGVAFFLISGNLPLKALPTLVFGGISPYALMAITAFILTGLVVEKSGLVQRLVRFSDSLVGHLPGGMAHTSIVSNMFFAGVSGASLADLAAIGSMMIPAMKQGGYGKKFSVVVNTAASIVGPIIPPSVPMIIYAYAAGGDVTVGGLFMAGAIPGIILGLGMMGLTYVYSVRRHYPINEEGFKIKEVFIRGKSASWGLMIPVIILVGILTGAFTPTEAGGVAATFALLTGVLITRKIAWRDLTQCLLETSLISAVIFMMLGNAKIITYVLSLNEAPEKLIGALQALTPNPYVFIILVLTFLVLLGFVLEAVATLIMLVPVLAPAAAAYGVEAHHFGLLVVMIIQLALITPPVALGLFLACRLADATIEEVLPDVWPFLIFLYVMMVAMAFFPGLTLWLPRVLGYVK